MSFTTKRDIFCSRSVRVVKQTYFWNCAHQRTVPRACCHKKGIISCFRNDFFRSDDDHQLLRSHIITMVADISQVNKPEKALGPVNNAVCSALTSSLLWFKSSRCPPSTKLRTPSVFGTYTAPSSSFLKSEALPIRWKNFRNWFHHHLTSYSAIIIVACWEIIIYFSK